MSIFDDGGPAFPMADGWLGLSLRDYFAGHAFGSMLTICQFDDWGHAGYADYLAYCADRSFAAADAMIARRKAAKGDSQ